MIVKNEAKNLRRCLKSVKGAVDEIIVVDTGSTDATVGIALACGAKVSHFPWNGNFSDARNASLEPAGGDWILFLDADEELAGRESREGLRRAVEEESVEGYFITIINYLGEEGRIEPHREMVFRLFRNRSEYRFRGAIHEQVAGPIREKNTGAVFRLAPGVLINHYGYLDSNVDGGDKINRNLEIIVKEMERAPENRELRFYLGLELYRAGRYPEAARELSTAAEGIDADTSYLPRLVRYIIMSHQAAGEPEKALQTALGSMDFFPRYADLYYYAGRMFMALKDYLSARDYLLRAVSMEEQPAHYASFNGVRGFRSYYHLGEIMEEFLNNSEALKFYLASFRDNPDFTPALGKIVNLLEPRKHTALARKYLQRFSFCTPRANLLAGQLLFRQGAYGLALEYFQKAAENQGADAEARLWAAACHIQERRYKQSLRLLKPFKPGSRHYPRALLNKMLACRLQNDDRQVRALVKEMAAGGFSEDMRNITGILARPPEKNNGLHRPLPGEEGRELLLDLVRRLLGLNETDRALCLLNSIDPRGLSGLLPDMARIFHAYDQGAAVLDLLRQKAIDGEDGETHFLLAEILREAGHCLEAELHYRRAGELEPGFPRYCLRQNHLFRQRREQLLQEARHQYPEDETLVKLGEEVPAN
jgi:glycosyltransferase involved in cell wall biosynthesis/Flp pilus assembly protein TadD